MQASEGFARYERDSEVLERIAKQYPDDSAEVAVLKQAAYALLFALTESHDEFTRYLAKMNRPMTEEDEKYLKKLGLE